MTSEEFGRRLDLLRQAITQGLASYNLWLRIAFRDDSASWSLEAQDKMLGDFKGFFTPIGNALFTMTFFQFAKLFDRHRNTASLWVLLNAARRQPSLVPNRTRDELDAAWTQLQSNRKILQRLRRRRNQQIAHIDANPKRGDPLIKRDFDKLIQDVKSAFNCLAIGHAARGTRWGLMLREIDRHSAEVLRLLMQETR